MKKIVLTIAAVAALAATASAPAEAHRLHLRPGAAIAAAAAVPLAAAAVAGIATEALIPGPDYYYAPTPLYYGAAPVILPYPGFRRHWW
jgi:hypothetical protein